MHGISDHVGWTLCYGTQPMVVSPPGLWSWPHTQGGPFSFCGEKDVLPMSCSAPPLQVRAGKPPSWCRDKISSLSVSRTPQGTSLLAHSGWSEEGEAGGAELMLGGCYWDLLTSWRRNDKKSELNVSPTKTPLEGPTSSSASMLWPWVVLYTLVGCLFV